MTEYTDSALQAIIKRLQLIAHVEGGYFSETYRAEHQFDTERGKRAAMTSIFYMLTFDSPLGYFHRNRSPIMHYYHQGDPIEYFVISPQGDLSRYVLGPDLFKGHHLQLLVEAENWKASRLLATSQHGYGLLGEAVAPGFDYSDMTLAQRENMLNLFPQHHQIIHQLTKDGNAS